MVARSRTTIRDVASLAGVSVTTVSDVVNGKGRVDPATRERVLNAVTDAGWRPRRSARALRSGESGVFALCVPRPEQGVGNWLFNADYDMALMAACAAAAMDSGRQLLLAPRPNDLADLGRLDVDGVILADPVEGDPALTVLARAGVPVVTVERDLRRSDGWWVESDSADSTTAMLEHLAAQGSRRIALVTSEGPWAWFEDTNAAYVDWCSRRGIRPQIRLVDLDQPRESAARATAGLLKLKNPPDAIFAVPAGAPLGVLDAVTATGRSVPDDLLLAAGSDSQTMQLAVPQITAIDLRPIDTARAAVDLLARRVSGEESCGPTVVRADLVVRASTMPAGR